MSNADLARTVAQHGQQLETLTGDVHAIRKSLGDLASAMGDIRSSLRTQEATRPPSVFEMVPQIRDVAILIGIGVTAIAWVLTAISGADTATMKRELTELREDHKTRLAHDRARLHEFERNQRIIIPIVPRGPST